MAEHPTPPQPPLSPDAGPTDPNLPKLPAGWIAQWDGRWVSPRFLYLFAYVILKIRCQGLPAFAHSRISSRKYYYVQISTGHSQWDIPADPALSAVSPAGTPAQASGPYDKPQEGQHGMEEGEGTRGVDGQTGERSGGLSVRLIQRPISSIACADRIRAWPSTCLPARAENTAAVNNLALADLLRLSLEEAISLTVVVEDMAKAAVEVSLDSSLEVF